MSETEHNDRPSSPSSEGGEGARRNRNRRRRGKKRPAGSAPAEGAEQDTADQGGDAPEESAPAGAAESAEGGERKKSRRRKKKKRSPADGESATEGAAEASGSEAAKPAAGPSGGGRRGDQARGPKKERAPRGSVLDRRRTRGEAVLDFPDDQPIMPAEPAPAATSVDGYIKQLRGWQREVVMTLRGIVKSQANDLTEHIMWSQPVYVLEGPVCYIKAFSDHVNIGFWRGNELEDLSDRLVGELQTMRHITIRHVNEVDRDLFESIVRKAVKLNREKGDPTA